jgi:hypothetical protein
VQRITRKKLKKRKKGSNQELAQQINGRGVEIANEGLQQGHKTVGLHGGEYTECQNVVCVREHVLGIAVGCVFLEQLQQPKANFVPICYIKGAQPNSHHP